MEYSDPHHKRLEFYADSFAAESEGALRRIIIVGHGQRKSLNLEERGSQIAAIIPEADAEFVLRNIQVIDKFKWLILDFEQNHLIGRILIHTERIHLAGFELALRSLIGSRPLGFHRR